MSEKKNGNGIRVGVSAVLAFLLSLLLVGEAALLIVKFSVLSKSGFEALVDSSYVRSVYENFNSEAYDYTLPTDIDPAVLDGVYSEDIVNRDILGFIDAAFVGADYSPDLSSREALLKQNVLDYFEAYYRELEEDREDDTGDGLIDEETKDIADGYVDEITALYIKTVKMPGIEAILEVRTFFDRVFIIALPIVTAAALFFIVLLFLLFKERSGGLTFLCYSFTAAAIMTAAAPAALYFGKIYERLNLAPEYFYRFVISFIRHTLEVCMTAGALLLIIAILFGVLSGVLRSSAKRREKDELQ